MQERIHYTTGAGRSATEGDKRSRQTSTTLIIQWTGGERYSMPFSVMLIFVLVLVLVLVGLVLVLA